MKRFQTISVVLVMIGLFAMASQFASARTVRFLATADLHFTGCVSGCESKRERKTLEKMVSLRDTYNMSGIIIAGDLICSHGGESDGLNVLKSGRWKQYKDAMGNGSGYVYDGLGNHDYDSGTDYYAEKLKDRLTRKKGTVSIGKVPFYTDCNWNPMGMAGPNQHRSYRWQWSPCYSWFWGGVYFVQLSYAPCYSTSYGKALAVDNLLFLKDTLSIHRGNSNLPVVIIQHLPAEHYPDPQASESYDDNAFWKVIEPYNVIAIITGHIHYGEGKDAPNVSDILTYMPSPYPPGKCKRSIPTFTAGYGNGGFFLEFLIEDSQFTVKRWAVKGRGYDGETVKLTWPDNPEWEETNSMVFPLMEKDIYVDHSAGFPYEGTESQPYYAIQDAIDHAFNGCTVWVRDGIYLGDNLDFKGKAITVKSENGPENCVIDCQSMRDIVGFYFHSGEDQHSVVDGFTIQGGYDGGAIFCVDSSPTIRKNIITGNVGMWGGGIHCNSASPVIENNTIVHNTGAFGGGGIHCTANSSPTIKNNRIMYNSSEKGAGIYTANSSPTIKNNRIMYNSSGEGAGIYCTSSSPKIITNVIAKNSATYNGGGIFCKASSLEILYNTITGNSAKEGGGGISVLEGPEKVGSLVVKNTILWDNSRYEIQFPPSSSTYYDTVEVSYSDVKGAFLLCLQGLVKKSPLQLMPESILDEDPQFVDASNDDYHLRDYSPCIGAGYEYTGKYKLPPQLRDRDIEGKTRGQPPDIGAYENSRAEPGYISLTSPNGGEVLSGGSSHDITWTSSGPGIDHIRLVYSTDSGSTYPHIITPSTPDNGTYEWSVPLKNSIVVRVKAIAEDSSSHELSSDASDTNFIIDSGDIILGKPGRPTHVDPPDAAIEEDAEDK